MPSGITRNEQYIVSQSIWINDLCTMRLQRGLMTGPNSQHRDWLRYRNYADEVRIEFRAFEEVEGAEIEEWQHSFSILVMQSTRTGLFSWSVGV